MSDKPPLCGTALECAELALVGRDATLAQLTPCIVDLMNGWDAHSVEDHYRIGRGTLLIIMCNLPGGDVPRCCTRSVHGAGRRIIRGVTVDELDLKRAEVVLMGDAATDEQLAEAVDDLMSRPLWQMAEVAQRWGISEDRLLGAAIRNIRATLGQGEHSV